MLPYERRSTFGPRTVKRLFAGKFVLAQRLASTGVSTLKRVTLDTSQTAPGYITGMSNVVTVRH